MKLATYSSTGLRDSHFGQKETISSGKVKKNLVAKKESFFKVLIVCGKNLSLEKPGTCISRITKADREIDQQQKHGFILQFFFGLLFVDPIVVYYRALGKRTTENCGELRGGRNT